MLSAARLPGRPIAPPPAGLVRRLTLPDGDRGAYQTAGILAALASGRSPSDLFPHSPRVREQAETILAHYQPATQIQQVTVLYEWLRSRVLYPIVRDHVRVEELRTPDYLLDRIAATGRFVGDCDDLVILLGALFESVGFPIRLVLIGTQQSGFPQEFSHIYLQTYVGYWIDADLIEGQPLGWRPLDVTRYKEIPVE